MESRQGRRSGGGASHGGKWLSSVFKSEKEGLSHERREGPLRRGISLFQGVVVLGVAGVVSEWGLGSGEVGEGRWI